MNIKYLSHHGILGQKWGVRRFQNRDGTRTPAGIKRDKANSLSDDELTAKVRRLNLENQYNKLSKENAKPSRLDKTKKVVDAASTLVNQAKNLNQESLNARAKTKLDLSDMTDQQLRERINRSNLERQYNDLFAKDEITVSRGREFAIKTLEVGGSALAVTSSALGIALAIKELRK